MSTQMIIRIEPELKDKVGRFARAEGKTTSDVVRELLEEYISSRDIAAYVDHLWKRIGGRLSAQGVTAERIPEAIQKIRRGKG
ncbi:MAG: ribbon-helix-helix protein, CopG family [Deltaproteobacteria bacterium]|nr:ribbon-helix-helix protein, CopG family [Deltaproteobacteria bacterium]